MKAKTIILRLLILIIFMGLNIGLDQVTKQIARTNLEPGKTVEVVGNVFIMRPALNEGAFLGIGGDFPQPWRTILLLIIPVVFIAGSVVYSVNSKTLTYFQTAALATILGGGISNIIDRLLAGMVYDFMNFGIGTLRTGIMNFADLSIVAGAVLLIVSSFQKKPEPVPGEEKK